MSELSVNLRTQIGAFALNAQFTIPATGITGVFGASGSGKSTLLRSVAGLHHADGTVRFSGTSWQDEATGFVPPYQRGVGWVAQESDLFPHLTVRQNLEYGFRRVRDAAPRQDWNAVVTQIGVGALLDRAPGGLSGGERQRVAIARALLASPRLLLMDEPVSALDEPARREIFPCIEALAGTFGVPVLYVSHSLTEVSRLADCLVWLVDGRVQHVGPVDQVVAQMNFGRWRDDDAGVVVQATVREHDATWSTTLLDSPWGRFTIPLSTRPVGARVRVQVRASDVSLGLAPQTDSSILNEFPMTVLDCAELDGGGMLVRLVPRGRTDGIMLARVMRVSANRLGIQPGRDVFARVKAAAVLG